MLARLLHTRDLVPDLPRVGRSFLRLHASSRADRGILTDAIRTINIGPLYRLARRQDELVLNIGAQGVGVALDELGLQGLTLGTELERQVVKPDVAIEVPVALDLVEALADADARAESELLEQGTHAEGHVRVRQRHLEG